MSDLLIGIFLLYGFLGIAMLIRVPVELAIIVYSILGGIVFYNVFQNKAPAHTKRNRIIAIAFFLALSSIIYFLVKFIGMKNSNVVAVSAFLISYIFTFPILGAELAYGISKYKVSVHIIRNCIIAFLFVYNAQFVYVITQEIDSWYGISYDRILHDYIGVKTPYGEFADSDDDLMHIKIFDKNGDYNKIYIYDVAEYDQYIVVTDRGGSYIRIDNQSNVTVASSLSELPEKVQQKDFVAAKRYTEDLYWKVHNDNHLYVVKGLISILLSALATALEYFLFRIVKKGIRRIKRNICGTTV